VIERLLEEAGLEIGAVTAASAGAMTAAALASGLATGGREGARATLSLPVAQPHVLSVSPLTSVCPLAG
jgi:predicted acylesterase/phospholipase RssA